MEEKINLKTYCIIGLGNIEEIKEDLGVVADDIPSYVSGEGLLISTFKCALTISEIEEFLNMNARSFIIFEMLPGTFSANILPPQFQEALFGGRIDNSRYNNLYNLPEGIKEFMKSIKEDLIDDGVINSNESIDENFDIDGILDKIGEVGMENLSTKEKKYLDEYSKNKK
tara:strand:- start:36 stop:545 length:510 start_codon:yes stop_codon:yes gene_type:complete